MAIEERKGKKEITFRIVAYDGYKLNKNGNYVQNRKTKTFRPPTGMTLREARKIAKQMEIDFNNQFAKEEISGINMTLNDLWMWYKKYYAPNFLRPTTLYTMEKIVTRLILPELGHIKLGHFTTNRITIFLNEFIVIKDKKTGKPVKPIQYYKDSYTQLVFSKLHTLFDCAIKQGWIVKNPCTNALIPKRNKAVKKTPLETEQIKDILKKTEKFTTYNAIIRFQIYTGMRIGETLALTWNDIDFDKKTISINKTVNYTKGNFFVGPPKTENSYRTLAMNNTIYKMLKLVKNEQDKQKIAVCDVWKDNNLVFCTDIGDYIYRNNISKRLEAIKKGTDYEYITVHFLRHANATLLLMNEIDLKIVSAHLGHNDIKTTANIYADVLKSKKQYIAQLIEFNLE